MGEGNGFDREEYRRLNEERFETLQETLRSGFRELKDELILMRSALISAAVSKNQVASKIFFLSQAIWGVVVVVLVVRLAMIEISVDPTGIHAAPSERISNGR